jgi:signal transduction histidine kinase
LWLSQKSARTFIITNASETTHVLAQQAALAILTESPENAENALQQVLSFPDVLGAGLVTKTGVMLDWQGDIAGKTHFSQIDWPNQRANDLLVETDQYWHIASLVVLSASDDQSELDLFESKEQNLGYALVSFSKQSLTDISQNLFIVISIASLLVLVGLPLVVTFVTRRSLVPLLKLSEVMLHNHNSGEHKKAQLGGAKEIQLMATSFNSMMETLDEQDYALRNHRDQLEAQVNIRTQELVVARDAALTSNRHKSEFLANVTHELRSPIQSIIGYVELVKDEAENEGNMGIVDDLDKVTRNAERLFSLINSLLDLSKIEAGRMEVLWQSVPLVKLLTELEEAIAPLVPQNNNRFEMINDCGDIEVTIDAEKSLQVLINLVSNACKFTINGEITVRVYRDKNKLLFAVTDNGIGIPSDKQESIFQKFQQIDGSESRKFGGTGLGLAIARQFCELMKGEILLTSEEGKGSCFTLVLLLD